MRNILLSLPAVLILLLLQGCASIVTKSEYPVTLQSNPSGASVTVTEARSGTIVHRGQTPTSVTLKTSAGYFKPAQYRVEMTSASGQTESFMIEGTPKAWYIAGNLGFGGIIGWLIVDPLTGAMFKFEDTEFTRNFQGVSELPAEEGNGEFHLKVVALDSIPEGLRGSLVAIN